MIDSLFLQKYEKYKIRDQKGKGLIFDIERLLNV